MHPSIHPSIHPFVPPPPSLPSPGHSQGLRKQVLAPLLQRVHLTIRWRQAESGDKGRVSRSDHAHAGRLCAGRSLAVGCFVQLSEWQVPGFQTWSRCLPIKHVFGFADAPYYEGVCQHAPTTIHTVICKRVMCTTCTCLSFDTCCRTLSRTINPPPM